MIAITPPKIFSKEVAQNRPPHFRTSNLPLTTRNRFTANFRGWRLDEFSIFARPPPRGLSLTPGREAFHPMDAAGRDHLICPGRAGPLICLICPVFDLGGHVTFYERTEVLPGRRTVDRLSHLKWGILSSSMPKQLRPRLTWLLASTPAFYEAYRQWQAPQGPTAPASSDRSSPTTPAP